ncbi:MAG: cell division protein FtsZ, partial [Solirubrobacteraceae bacterium]
MANPKRASMREGPLAALFRKTEELEKDEPVEQPAADAATPAGAVEPASEAAASAGAAEPASATSPSQSQAQHPRESGVPHPSLRPSIEQDHGTAHIPSPQERLRHAFSSEIPENLMERPGVAPESDAPHGRNAYTYEAPAQEQPRPFGAAIPVTQPVIRVVGVGGAGTNAVNRMVEAEVEGVEFLAINTDLQSLQQSTADITLHIGAELTRGLGSGSDANVGRQAAMDDYDRVKALLKGSDMI